jgi:hypothetical protein
MDRRQVLGAALALAGCRAEPGPDLVSVSDSGSGLEGSESYDPEPEAPDQCAIGSLVLEPHRRMSAGAIRLTGRTNHRLSPDGRTLLARDDRNVAFVPLDGRPARSFPLEGPSFGDDDDSVAWSADSRSVWLLKGETARSGFSTGPLAVARRWMDGRIEPAPALANPPGRLDQVRWVADSDLGVASFDLRGGYYRPELPDTGPTLAVIEAATGRVRSRVSIRDDLLASWGSPEGNISCEVVAATLMPNGRVRSLVRAVSIDARRADRARMGGLVLWTEGEAPAVLPEKALEGAGAFVDTGRKLLIRLPLAVSGVIHEHRPSPPPTPASGAYAGLYDLQRRQWVWRLSGQSTRWNEGNGVAVSASGRKALIGLPASCRARGVYGLIDVRTGRIRQRLLAPNNAQPTLGFDGERPWLAWGGILDLYGGPLSGLGLP